MKVGDVVWVRGTVAQITPNVLLVNLMGPSGTDIPAALHPKIALMEDDPPTPAT